MQALENKSIFSKDLGFQPFRSIGLESSQSFMPARGRQEHHLEQLRQKKESSYRKKKQKELVTAANLIGSAGLMLPIIGNLGQFINEGKNKSIN